MSGTGTSCSRPYSYWQRPNKLEAGGANLID